MIGVISNELAIRGKQSQLKQDAVVSGVIVVIRSRILLSQSNGLDEIHMGYSLGGGGGGGGGDPYEKVGDACQEFGFDPQWVLKKAWFMLLFYPYKVPEIIIFVVEVYFTDTGTMVPLSGTMVRLRCYTV